MGRIPLLDGEQYDVLAYGLLMMQAGYAWPPHTQIAAHMDWRSKQPVGSALRRLEQEGYVTKVGVARMDRWKATDAGIGWGIDNPRRLESALRREGEWLKQRVAS